MSVAAGEGDKMDEADETIVAAARGNESQTDGDEDVSAARGDDTPAVRRSSRQRRTKQLD